MHNNLDEDSIKINILNWFTLNRKGENEEKSCFWKLYQVRTMQSAINIKTPAIAVNYSVESPEESTDLLMENLSNFHHIQFICIKLMKGKNDNSSLIINTPNPYFVKDGQVGGYGGMYDNSNQIGALNNNYIQSIMQRQDDRIMALQQSNMQQIEMIRMEYQHEKEKNELYDEIAALKQNKSSLIGEIFAEVKEPLIELLGLVVVKMTSGQITDVAASTRQEEPKTIEESKFKHIEPIIQILSNNYGEYQDLLGELTVISQYDKNKMDELRLIINQTAFDTQQQHGQQHGQQVEEN